MSKKNKNVFLLVCEALKLYFSNFNEFVKYMTFPVLGQALGIILSIIITYFYVRNLPTLVEKYDLASNLPLFLLITVLVISPALLILAKSLWEYLVAYGAINSMFLNMQKSGRVYDFEAHTELVKRRTFKFIAIWFIIGLFSVVAICPLFWIICGILGVYFLLVFQVFTFEAEASPVGCFKRSLFLIKGHFTSSFVMITLLSLLTYILVPQLVIKAMTFIHLDKMFAYMLIPFISLFKLPDFQQYGVKSLSNMDVALNVVNIFVAQIFIQYTLPIRSIACSLFYKELNSSIPVAEEQSSSKNKKKKVNSKTKKRPSEILMENSHKKFCSKKLDRNIIKRASQKED